MDLPEKLSNEPRLPMATIQVPAPGPAPAAVSTSGDDSGSPPALVNPSRWHPRLAPLQTLLERATAIKEELAQGQDKPFTEVICCYSGDAAATGHQPLAILQQVAAICAYPKLLGAEDMPREAKRRAGQILQHLQGGSPGAYNLEYVTNRVAPTVARYLAQRDGGVPSDPCSIFPCSGTAAALVDTMSLLVDVTSACPTGVLVPVPGPPVHAQATGLAGAVAVPYPLAEEQGWAVDVGMVRQELHRAQARCHPKVLCVVNPGDPTGHVLSRQNMVDIIQLVAEENLLLLADETEQDRAFDPNHPFVSFKRVLWEMGDPLSSTVQIISFYSLSKAFGGGDFRAGFFELVNIDPSLLKGFYIWGLSVYPCIVGQVMLETALDLPLPTEAFYPDWEERQRLCHHLAQQWQLLQEVLGQGSLRCQPGHGGARACPQLQLPPRALRQAQELGLEPDVFFCQQLLEATGVLLAPGSEFGQPEGTQHVVVSLLPPAATLEQVLLALIHFYATFIQDFS